MRMYLFASLQKQFNTITLKEKRIRTIRISSQTSSDTKMNLSFSNARVWYCLCFL